MKKVKILLSAALALVATTTFAQDFSDPKYAKWGETAEEREQNMMASNYLKEEYKMKDYNRAAHYLNIMLKNCPAAVKSTYQYGANIYKKKIAKATSAEEKQMFIDSLLLIYDLRLQYFGNSQKQGAAYILDRKAREVLTYMPDNRAAVREAFRQAIEAGGQESDPETVVAYFSNLCDDYKNTDEVTPDEIIAEYDRLSPIFGDEDAAEFKKQFDAAFGMSGAASCENLEKLFKERLDAAPEDVDLLSQAVALMSRAKCNSDFYFNLAEKYYEVKPSSETAIFLAQAFQNKGDYERAVKYLNEALAVEENPSEKENLYTQIALVEMVSNHTGHAAMAAREALKINDENGLAYFVLAQCHALSASSCGDFAGKAVFWIAYDTMAKAVDRLEGSEFLEQAKQSLSAYRYRFPSKEECFFNDVQPGTSYTVNCGTAHGTTTVRTRD